MSFGYFAQGLVGGLEAGQRFSRNAQLMRDYEEERQREIESRKAIEGFVGDPLFGAQPGTMPAPSPVAPVPQARGLGAPTSSTGGGQALGAGRASLVANESGGRWNAKNDVQGSGGRGHFGRLQFSRGRMQDYMRATGEHFTPEQFMSSPELQQRVEDWHFGDIDRFVGQRGLGRYLNATVGGTPMTQDAMRAVAHLGGNSGLERFLTTGGRYNPADANGTRLSDYAARHGGIDTRMVDVSGQPSPAVGPYGLPDRGAPSYQTPQVPPQQRAERAAQMAQTVQPYAQKYMEGLKIAARDPKAAAQLAPLLQQIKTQGMAQWLNQFEGDISTMAGAHQLVVHAANGMAMFGEMPDIGGLYDMAKDRETLGRDAYRTGLDERRLALAESQAGLEATNSREVLLKRQLENDVYTRTHLMELIDTGQAGPAKDFAKTHLGIDIMEMQPDVLEVPELGVTLPTVSVTYRDANGETQTVKAAEVLYKTTLYEAAIRQRLKGGGTGDEAGYKFTAGEREALNQHIDTLVDEACVGEYGGECNEEQRLGLRREIEPQVIAEAQRFMDETARPAGAAQTDDLFSDDVMLHLDSVFGDEE